MNKYMVASILSGSMIFAVGCSSQKNSDNMEQVVNTDSKKEDNNVIYGKVSEINNDEITLSIGNMNTLEKTKNEEKPSDKHHFEDRDDMPNKGGRGNRPEMPNENQNGDKPTMPNDEQFSDRPTPPDIGNNDKSKMPDIITLTGESKVITISSDINITKISDKTDDNKNTLSISDMNVGDIIKINYNNNKTIIESIEIISFNNIKNPKNLTTNNEE